MTREEEAMAELAAMHAERAAERLKARGNLIPGAEALRMFAASLRVGAHLRPAGSEAEGQARAVAIVGDLIEQAERISKGRAT
jgi:hypothetical protein